MKKQVIEKFDQWIFEAAPSTTSIPAGYKETTLPEGTTELSTVDEISKAKGWKALPDSDSLQVSGLKFIGSGLASDKVAEFNQSKAGILVMSPTIYGKGAESVSFIVGFPYHRVSLEGKDSKKIVLSEKYILFTPFENGKENVFRGSSPSQTGAAFSKPYDFRLISVDKPVTAGMQSLLWILGFNNSDQAKKALKSLPEADVISLLKGGLDSLSKTADIKNDSKSGKILYDGYNALITSSLFHQMIFNNFVDGHPKMDLEKLKTKLPVPKATA